MTNTTIIPPGHTAPQGGKPVALKKLQDQALDRYLEPLVVKASNDTPIPIPAFLVGRYAKIQVQGDGRCCLDGYSYYVTIVNFKSEPKPQAASKDLVDGLQRGTHSLGTEMVKSLSEESVIKFAVRVLRAIGDGKLVHYIHTGAKIYLTLPVSIVTSLLSADNLGKDVSVRSMSQTLPDGSKVLIEWLGDPV